MITASLLVIYLVGFVLTALLGACLEIAFKGFFVRRSHILVAALAWPGLLFVIPFALFVRYMFTAHGR